VEYEITVETTPLYQATALQAMKEVLARTKTPDQAWDIMNNRRSELLLNEQSGRNLLSSMVMQALGGPLEQTHKFAKVNNEAATYDHLLEALEAKEALISILAKSGWDEFERFDETFCNPYNKQSANGFLLSDERLKLYRIFLNRSLRKSPDGTLTDEAYSQVKQIQGLLGLTDNQVEIETRRTLGPYLQKVLQRATDEISKDYTAELASNMKKEIDATLANYRLTNDYLRESGASFYAQAVEAINAKAPGGIPTTELFEALVSLRDMFQLSVEDTYPSHTEYFGSVYKKSVLEAMGTTGVIRPEFREPLQVLRKRLGLPEEECDRLFLEAVAEKMKPMVEWIGSEMERTMLSQKQLSQRRGKDMGEDVFITGKGADGVLGLGADVNIMSDIMELIDFYKENDITEKVMESVFEDDETIEKEVTKYPVTALGLGAVDQELAEILYRQFVVSAFTTQKQDKAARYDANREFFAGILGLDQFQIDEINSNIGNTVYDNIVTQAVKTKGAMDQQDFMTIASVQGKLGLSDSQSEKMLLQAQKKILSEEIDSIMEYDPTPERIKAFREKCNSMGLDMREDVGVSTPRLARMFEQEVIPGLKAGTITGDNNDILGEIQESLGIEPEEVEAMFESVLVRLSNAAVALIKGELLRGREENTVDLIKEIIRYAAFTEGDLGLNTPIEEAMAHQICNIYDALDFTGVPTDEVESNKELLKISVGLS
jgi:hypothetical protein